MTQRKRKIIIKTKSTEKPIKHTIDGYMRTCAYAIVNQMKQQQQQQYKQNNCLQMVD